jgi:uncharacterized protein YodC (DUF2158 family)
MVAPFLSEKALAMQFNPGDVVRLKSGGPKMTIDSKDGEDYFCIWFDSKNEQKQNSFSGPVLEAVENHRE